MLSTIIAIFIVVYVIVKFTKGGYMKKVLEFIGLVSKSTKEKGARGTVHSVVDGLFDNSAAIKDTIKSGASKVTGATKQKVAGLKPADFEYDADTGELVLFLSKTEDLVLSRDRTTKRVSAVLVELSGRETELSQKAFERHLAMLARKGKLSDSQERALKDWMIAGRRESQEQAERTGRIPRNK